jgi:hypothetical protein
VFLPQACDDQTQSGALRVVMIKDQYFYRKKKVCTTYLRASKSTYLIHDRLYIFTKVGNSWEILFGAFFFCLVYLLTFFCQIDAAVSCGSLFLRIYRPPGRLTKLFSRLNILLAHQAQAVSRWLYTAAAWVRVRAACGVCGGQSGTGAGFL